MDHDWARTKLSGYVRLFDDLWRLRDTDPGQVADEITTEISRATPLVSAILQRLSPQNEQDREPLAASGYMDRRERALEGLGLLDLLEEIEKLGPVGPSLNASQLHPWAWQAAQAFWDSRHFAQAVEQAWKSINAHLQRKTRRLDVSDDVLINETLSPTPAGEGKIKIRARGDQSSPTWSSRQRGMHALGQACAAGIRNVVVHEDQELPQQTALEYLATLSVLAHWIDDAATETGA